MRLALLILCLMLSGSASAGPVAVAIAAWASVTVATVYVAAATILLSAGMAVYGTAQARRAARDARNQSSAELKDRMATRIASESPHRYIYGRARVGADIVAMFTSGSSDQFKHLVCVHAAHECDAIEEVYVANIAVGLLNSDGDATTGRFFTTSPGEIIEESKTGPSFVLNRYPVQGSIYVYSGTGANMVEVAITVAVGSNVTVAFTGPVRVVYEWKSGVEFNKPAPLNEYRPNRAVVKVQRHLGGADDLADAYLMSQVPGKWASTAVLRGLCYTVISLDLTQPEFQSGQVPVHALIRGKKLYDPRTGLTTWSMNPALAIYDYLTGPLCGVDAADLPLAQFIAAANVCDEAVVTGGRYTINGSVTSDQTQSSVLESMAQCMAGSIVSTTWDIYAGKYVAPLAALVQADIVGSMQVTPGVSDAAIYNGVKGQFISSDNKYVLTDFKPYQNSAYRENDGRDYYTNIDFPFTDSLQRVTNLARIFTEDHRNGFTVKAEFSLKAWPLKVGQRVTLTSEFLGQTAKVYRITDKAYSPTSAVALTLKEDDASIWDLADATVVDSTPNTDLPDPWEILPLASLTCDSGEATLLRQADGTMVPRMLVTWPAATTQAVVTNGQIEIEFRAIGTEAWEKAIVTGSETSAYLSPITPGFFYVVRARCVNPYLNTKSEWIFTTYQVQVFAVRPVVYMWAASQPAPPTGSGSYTWSTAAYTAPAGWSLTVPTAPSGGNESLWEASVLVSDVSASGSTAFDWSIASVVAIGYAPSAAGTGPAGYSNARVFAYQRASTAPAGTPGAVNYDFTTGTITTATLANGWLKTIPASNGNPLYVTSASASAAGTTDSIGSGEWSGAVVLAYDGGAGTAGLNNATITLYQRAASATSPTKPSALTTYTFATGALAGLNNGWTTYIPSAGGAYLHTTFATAIATTATDTIAASEWATVQLMYDAAAVVAAQAAADAAAASALLANNALAVIADDNKLSKGEKPAVILEWQTIQAEATPIYSLGGSMGAITERDAYNTAYVALLNYMNTLDWATLSTDTTIDGPTFRLKFKDYYAAKMTLLNAISTKIRSDAEADATFKAATAQANAISTAAAAAQAKADLAEVTAKAYADGIVDAEEARAIADATAKASAAQAAATAAAAADATAKANVAATMATGVSLSPTGVLSGGGTSGQMTALPTIDLGDGSFFGARNRNDAPGEYPVGTTKQFKTRASLLSTDGLAPAAADTYCTLETIKQYVNSSGGGIYQYAYIGAKTFRRLGPNPAYATPDGSGWFAWVQDLDRAAYIGDLDASKGAPAGTLVAGVDAATLVTQAAAGSTASTVLASPPVIGAMTDVDQHNITNGSNRLIEGLFASMSGGEAPYTYTWSVTGTAFLSAYTGSSPELRGSGSNSLISGRVTCIGRDNKGRTSSTSIAYTAGFGSM